MNAGEGNGKSAEWYQAHTAKRTSEYNLDYKSFEDTESDRCVWNRLYLFYIEILNNKSNKIVIVSHGVALSFLHAMIIGDRFEDIKKRVIRGRGGVVPKFHIEKYGRVIIRFIGNLAYIA